MTYFQKYLKNRQSQPKSVEKSFFEHFQLQNYSDKNRALADRNTQFSFQIGLRSIECLVQKKL